MKFIVFLLVNSCKAVQIGEAPAYLCTPIESGIEKLQMSEEGVIKMDPKEVKPEIEEKPQVGEEDEKEEIKLEGKEMEVIELQVEDEDGEEATLTIYPGLLDIPRRYQEFDKQGFLSDELGNLIDLDGEILVSAE